MNKILLIHPDPKAADELTSALQHSGFQVLTAAEDQQALAEILRTELAVIVIAEALAEANMWIREICEAPIIILGQHSKERAGLRFLEAGADAYIASPLDSRLLLARIRSLLRRSKMIGKTEGGDAYGKLAVGKDPLALRKTNDNGKD